MQHPPRRFGAVRVAIIGVLTVMAIAMPLPGAAHGFTSVVYADVKSTEAGAVTAELELEYDLLVVSAADAEDDDPLFEEGIAAFDAEDSEAQAAALEAHDDAVFSYVADRFTVASAGEQCRPEPQGEMTMTEREGVPYATLTLDQSCAQAGEGYTVTSGLFPDDEGYVTGTTTILTYDLDAQSGSAVLDASLPSFSAGQGLAERLGAFFLLGAEHLLGGIDHILFLLALIVGSRRLREVVFAATAFTIAHSITFILAATGAVAPPPEVVEPVIALSISVVAAWYLWQLWRKGDGADSLDTRRGALQLDRAAWLRLAVVFVFGLVHGLGFAGALGIDEPWSWSLLASLLVFNVGIEVVQVGIIVVVFSLLVLLRRRTPHAATWIAGAVAGGVTVTGLVWFVQRVFGL